MIVTVYSQAGYNSPWGSCDDGYHDAVQYFGPPPPAPPNSGSSSGTHYIVYHAPGNGFYLQLTPNASSGPGNSYASVSMTLTDVVVSTAGGLYPGLGENKDECLPGQYNQSSIYAGGFVTASSNPSWTLSGPGLGPMASPDWGGSPPPLPSVQTYVSPPRHTWITLPSQYGQTTAPYFWTQGGQAIATCNATAYDPSGNSIGAITGHYKLTVKGFDFRSTASYGHSSYLVDGAGNVDAVNSGSPGMSYWCYALTPIEFERPTQGWAAEGAAYFAAVQLIDSVIGISGSIAGAPASFSWNSQGFALDNQFPYDYALQALLFAPVHFPSGTAQATDSPSVELEPPFTISSSYSISDQFEMFLAYVGPTVSGMPNAEYIPLQMLSWQWINADSAPWQLALRDPQGGETTDFPTSQFQ